VGPSVAVATYPFISSPPTPALARLFVPDAVAVLPLPLEPALSRAPVLREGPNTLTRHRILQGANSCRLQEQVVDYSCLRVP
jgi:hypothetical protein